MKKAVIAAFLMLIIGFALWRMIAGELFHPAEKLAAKVDTENFTWFACSNCGKLFMAKATTRRGYCPYCEFEMMLISEDRRVLGRSVDESKFIWFLSPNCGQLFYAFETNRIGKCPHCGEAINLTAPPTTDLEQPPPLLVSFVNAHWRKLFLGTLGLFIVSVTGIYLLLERQTVFSLQPLEGALSEETKIELSRRQSRKKKLTLGNSVSDDIVLKDPSLKDIHCILSLVRVGGKTHVYLRHHGNKPILVNDKPEYNPKLSDHDKVRLGDVIFEVHAHGKRDS